MYALMTIFSKIHKHSCTRCTCMQAHIRAHWPILRKPSLKKQSEARVWVDARSGSPIRTLPWRWGPIESKEFLRQTRQTYHQYLKTEASTTTKQSRWMNPQRRGEDYYLQNNLHVFPDLVSFQWYKKQVIVSNARLGKKIKGSLHIAIHSSEFAIFRYCS